jgi:REP element-mobilizing transposase RayT
MVHPPRIPVWLKSDQSVIYFLTFCVAKRQKVLANDETFTALRTAIGRLTNWKVIAAILMPDHVHLLIAPVEREAAVGNAAAAIKRFVRRGCKVSARTRHACHYSQTSGRFAKPVSPITRFATAMHHGQNQDVILFDCVEGIS